MDFEGSDNLKILCHVNMALIFEKLKIFTNAIKVYKELFDNYGDKINAEEFEPKI